MWIEDLRNAFRGLRSARGFALTAILSVSIGIGGSVSMFTVVNSVLLKPQTARVPRRRQAGPDRECIWREALNHIHFPLAIHPMAKADTVAGFDRFGQVRQQPLQSYWRRPAVRSGCHAGIGRVLRDAKGSLKNNQTS